MQENNTTFETIEDELNYLDTNEKTVYKTLELIDHRYLEAEAEENKAYCEAIYNHINMGVRY
jgi:hypothetical protein